MSVDVNSIQLRLVEPNDAQFILNLRLDPSRNRHMSPVENNLEAQERWICDYQLREAAGSEYYFLIESCATPPIPWGTVRLYDFRENSFSWGSWMLRPEASQFAAIESALAVYDFGFGQLGFTMSHFETRLENIKVIRFHERFGAVRIREDETNVYFQFSAETFARIRANYVRFLNS
jgi:RimJ/RimL family protein N-acetyltransferase